MIKVADFGMSEDMYVRNYFRRDKSDGGGEEKVPIRWMAPESIEKDIYNERTDVVRHILILVVGLLLVTNTCIDVDIVYGTCLHACRM